MQTKRCTWLIERDIHLSEVLCKWTEYDYCPHGGSHLLKSAWGLWGSSDFSSGKSNLGAVFHSVSTKQQSRKPIYHLPELLTKKCVKPTSSAGLSSQIEPRFVFFRVKFSLGKDESAWRTVILKPAFLSITVALPRLRCVLPEIVGKKNKM